MLSNVFIFLFFFILSFDFYFQKTYHIYPNTTIGKVIGGIDKASKVMPGDIFQFHEGLHLSEQYMTNLKGSPENHIIIKGEPGVVLENSSYYTNFEYVDFKGPFEIRKTKSSYAGGGDGIQVRNSHYITMSDFYIHNVYKNAMRVTGTNIIIKNNLMNECCLMNVNCSGTSWGQTISTEKQTETELSQNILIENNFVSNSWGEGIDLLYCEYCTARNNTIHNAHSVMMYTDNSRNLIIEKNLLYITRQDFTKKYRACAFGIGTESHGHINATNITIRNNLAISCGHAFHSIGGKGYYADLHIVHNTFYNTSSLTLQFPGIEDPDNVKNNHVSNNVFSASANINEKEKNSWTSYANLWIDNVNCNYPLQDAKGYEGTSVFIKNETLKEVTFPLLKKEPNCLEPRCFLPKCLDDIDRTKDKWGNLMIRKGLKSEYSDGEDFYGRKRDKINPTIGFSEFCYEPEEDKENSGGYIKWSVLGIMLTLAEKLF